VNAEGQYLHSAGELGSIVGEKVCQIAEEARHEVRTVRRGRSHAKAKRD